MKLSGPLKRVFVIGPGGVGKTTCGRIFAGLIGHAFVDLDVEFMRRIGPIGRHIAEKGYRSYRRENSALFFSLLEEQSEDTVFALSSGFLVHEGAELEVPKNKRAIRDLGIAILLLPSRSMKEAEEIIVARQLTRGLGCRSVSERKKVRDRFPTYLQCGDIQIFSAQNPKHVADEMKIRYELFAE